MEIKKLLEQHKYAEELWETQNPLLYHVINKFPNGRFYIEYNVSGDDETSSLEGPFSSLENAANELKNTYSNATKIWEKELTEMSKGNLNLLYTTHFQLLAPVDDFGAAYEYLKEDDMTEYLHSDSDISQSAKDKVDKIEWVLKDEQSGRIEVKTNDYLSDSESQEISDWVSGQCSDGLGEGFGQQSFACYRVGGYEGFGGEYDEYYEDEYVTAEFDWRANSYNLELVQS